MRRGRDSTAVISGVVFVVLGCVFLLERLGVLDVPPSFVIPVLLIGVGIGLIFGRADDRDIVDDVEDRPAVAPTPTEPLVDEPRADEPVREDVPRNDAPGDDTTRPSDR